MLGTFLAAATGHKGYYQRPLKAVALVVICSVRLKNVRVKQAKFAAEIVATIMCCCC
jgi:hypothetical protein